MARKIAADEARHPDPEVVREAEEIFAGIGMSPEKAISTFYKLTALHSDGIRAAEPLGPNSLAAFDEPRLSIVIYTVVDEMMADLWKDGRDFNGEYSAAAGLTLAGPGASDSASVVRRKAGAIFKRVGMTSEEAVAVFYERTARHDECLLCLAYGNTPNDETLADMSKDRADLGIRKYASLAEMRAELDQDAGTPHECSLPTG